MGILSAFASMLTSSLESISVKNITKKITIYEYLIYRSILSLPFIALVVYISGLITIDFSRYYIIIVIALLSILNNFCHFFSVDRMNIVLQNMIRRTYIIVTAILLYFTGIEPINKFHFIGIIVVLLGLYLGVNLKNTGDDKIDKLGLIVCLIGVIMASLFSIGSKYALNSELLSPSGLVIVESVSLFIYSLYLIKLKRPEKGSFKNNSKKLFLLSTYPPIIMFFLAYGYQYAGVSITNSVKTLMSIPVYIYNIIMGVEKFNIKKAVGLSLCIIGTAIVVVA